MYMITDRRLNGTFRLTVTNNVRDIEGIVINITGESWEGRRAARIACDMVWDDEFNTSSYCITCIKDRI